MNSGKIGADGTGGREKSKVLQEVLADLKVNIMGLLVVHLSRVGAGVVGPGGCCVVVVLLLLLRGLDWSQDLLLLWAGWNWELEVWQLAVELL